jgi:inorganic pyrophosphatase
MSNKSYLGQTVTVTIDRPLGSRHPKYPERIYPINYGFIAGTVSGDGEELDAYILGIDKPVNTFEGVVRAIIHRTNDDDDKLVVTPENYLPTDQEIREATHFQEQFFSSDIWR